MLFRSLRFSQEWRGSDPILATLAKILVRFSLNGGILGGENKFETSYSIVKSPLIGYHLSYDNQSKDILNVFDLVLMINFFKMDMRKFC